MTTGMRVSVAVSGLVLLAAAGARPAEAAPKKSVCGAKILPLAEGNSWTYERIAAPQPILPELVKVAPEAAKKIVITVTSVDSKGGDKIVHLEEKVTYELRAENGKPPATADVIVHSTITCGRTKLEISPDAFWFSAEPGGYRELTFDKFERSRDTSLKLTRGTIGDQPWREDIVAHFVREPAKGSDAKLSGGKLELERSFTPENPEAVVGRDGLRWDRAEKLALVTTGRVTFDHPSVPTDKPSELPANWISKFWFATDVGVVQTLNMYAHMYQLTAFKVQ